jgi:GST-like protein
LKPAPYLLGSEMTALDVYAAMLSRWEPGRAWVDEHCRQVASALALAEQDPIVARVWERNFKR